MNGLKGNQKPLEWKLLWRIIVYHEGGICDRKCPDLRKLEKNTSIIERCLNWLLEQGFLSKYVDEFIWDDTLPRYELNWENVKGKLEISPPPPLEPISLEKFEEMLRDN
jgi:hypothetical protein